ncbi:MAG: YlxM family DNA-binding protein [Niameybacter sp.]|uniref:YlxM family DNA-binding protein n=1 Tax=Niameybacter sp. TaxID=2033640 RepID=UPI002FCC9AC6
MEKFVEVSYLYDFYESLLTDKQRDLLMRYYFDDLSLGELATTYNISRQSVFDTIKKAEHKMLDLESKLGLWTKYVTQEKILTEVKDKLKQFSPSGETEKEKQLQEAIALLEQLSSEM